LLAHSFLLLDIVVSEAALKHTLDSRAGLVGLSYLLVATTEPFSECTIEPHTSSKLKPA
jgi:hypothetical protein